MKKFKVKINCPGQILGSIVETNENGFIKDYNGIKIYPDAYPHIFEEIKEPLFVTEDGKNIFVGIEYYWINTNLNAYIYNIEHGLYQINKSCMEEGDEKMPFSDGVKTFSTKEAAEKWIEENKPVYSKKQLYTALLNCKSIVFFDKELIIYENELKKELGL